VFRPVRDFTKYTARLAKASAAGDRVLALLEQEQAVKNRPNAQIAPYLDGDIVFEHVEYGYGTQPVLNDIQLTVKAGEKTVIVGPSGSGKSTLAGLLMRLYDPKNGRVTIGGFDVRDVTLASLRKQIAVVLQDTLLFATTIGQNITAGLENVAHEDVISAAKLANIHEFIMTLPQGYDTPVGEKGVTLSAGQRQRVSIARAAIRKTPILILDEPTTGLDPATEKSVNEALERLSEKRTTIVITHRFDTAAGSDHIVLLRDGCIIEQGSHERLIEHNKEYVNLFAMSNAPDTGACHVSAD